MELKYNQPLVSIVVLDYNRPKESELLLFSIKQLAKFDYELVYVSNGGDQDYVQKYYNQGLIDVLVLCKKNGGTGLGTRQGFKAANGKYVIYIQVDQWLKYPVVNEHIYQAVEALEKYPDKLYYDFAGNQGNGQFSERALMINREKYLAIPDLQEAYGGPGPWAHVKWSEQGVQEYMKREGLTFFSAQIPLFGDNGKNSLREYPCGGQLLQETDTKKVFIVKPITQRIDFPNVKLNDVEWEQILSGKWIDGTIPEGHKDSSFTFWEKPLSMENVRS